MTRVALLFTRKLGQDRFVEENQVICYRCGFIWIVAPKKRKDRMLCGSCRAKPTTTIQYGKSRCISWNGLYAKDGVTPILDGEPFMPGERTCGHADCVASGHQANRLSATTDKTEK